MVKVLTGKKLPNDLDVFKARMIKFCRGINVRGLETLAKNLKVDRVAGNSHQAGSDNSKTFREERSARIWNITTILPIALFSFFVPSSGHRRMMATRPESLSFRTCFCPRLLNLR
ncbi:hypothetical protein Ahy_A05g024322 [Arachis hypogaea]|uniref:Uncharacterized protein n=1 Tax=Arachis hypogaea TaxID=3818 RepID=A0A445D5K9_ARAHY|nr:hypothetical protein Ahy_A05g024322 [Arachis hypogaea]